MKWIALAILVISLNGCATTKHAVAHRVHRKHKKTQVVTAVGDDAAIKAIIKSLRE